MDLPCFIERILHSWEYPLPGFYLCMAEIHSHLDKWLHFVTSVILQINIPQLEGGREMEETSIWSHNTQYISTWKSSNTDNMLEGNRIFKANMNG